MSEQPCGCCVSVCFKPGKVMKSKSESVEISPSEREFEQQFLEEHNSLRALHGSPPLVLSRDLCKIAKEWAKVLADEGILRHRLHSQYGENLYMSSGKIVTGRTPVKAWYDEIKDYNFDKGEFHVKTGHFTQVVWKNTIEVGVAYERRDNKVWVVANYSPPGNFRDKFTSNVPKLLR